MLVGSVASVGLSLAYDYERCIEPLVNDGRVGVEHSGRRMGTGIHGLRDVDR